MKVNEKRSILLMREHSKESKDGKAPLIVRLTVDSKRTEMSLGHKVSTDIWNQDAGCVKGNSQEAIGINATIDRVKSKIRQCYDTLAAKHDYVSALMVKLNYLGKDIQVEVKEREEVISKTLRLWQN